MYFSPSVNKAFLHSQLQWNIHALVLESTQAREDRKKRVRILLSLSAVMCHDLITYVRHPCPSLIQKELKKLAKAQAAVSSAAPSNAVNPPIPSSTSPPAAATPTLSGHVPARSSTPRPATALAPTSAQPAAAQQPPQQLPRGVKRDHEESVTQANTQGPGTVPNGTGPPKQVSVGTGKAGIAGARPRPVKKQRMVSLRFDWSNKRARG